MRIGYLYDLEAFPPKGGNHVHAYELTQAFLALGYAVSVIDDPTMPGVRNYSSALGQYSEFIASVDALYVRIDARPTCRWQALSRCQEMAGWRPVVWEINAPANEALAYSWLGGRPLLGERVKEGVARRVRRHVHAFRQMWRVRNEEKHRKQLARRVDAATCVSSSLAEYAMDGLGIERAVVLPNGGPLLTEDEIDRRRQGRKSTAFTVLYSGSAMYPWQGLDLLLQTIKLASREVPEIRFVLAVNQPASGLVDLPNVEVRHALDRENLLDAISQADVCVALHPEYPWSPYGFHNSPMKMFEYMGCMRPVVASNHGQMRELLANGEGGVLCENQPEDVLHKICYLRDHPEVAATIGRAGWRRVHDEHNWVHNAEVTVGLIDEKYE